MIEDGEYNHLIAQNVILVADFAIFRRGGGGSTELRQDIALIQVLFHKFIFFTFFKTIMYSTFTF